MKQIVFGITSLQVGGAERVLVDLVGALKEEYEITIATLYPGGELEKQLDKKIILKSLYEKPYASMSFLEKRKVSFAIALQARRCYQKLELDQEVQIAFLEGPMTRLFSKADQEKKKIAWVHSDIRRIFGRGWKGIVKKMWDRKKYETYNDIVLVSKDNAKAFTKTYPKIPETRLQVIENYLCPEIILQKAQEKIPAFRVVEEPCLGVVARLVEAKAIDRLIQVHKRLIQKGYRHHIYVIGDGPQRQSLKAKIQEEQAEETFVLLGEKQNPYPYMKQVDAIVLASLYEGLPVTLLEAKILQKDIIITDTAARETIEQYERGWVVENSEDGIFEGICQWMKERNRKTNQQMKAYENGYILNQIRELIEVK